MSDANDDMKIRADAGEGEGEHEKRAREIEETLRTADAKKRADAEEAGKQGAKLDKLLEAVDGVTTGLDTVLKTCDSLGKRMDAIEGKGAAAPSLQEAGGWDDLDDDERDRMTDEEAQREPGKPKSAAADAAKARFDAAQKSMNAADKHRRDDNRKAHAQARADAVLLQNGERAPAPLAGETVRAYRTRLLRDVTRYSETHRGVDVGAISDSKLFGIAERTIFTDAAAIFKNPQLVAGDELRMVTRDLPSGHKEHVFYGHPASLINQFAGTGRLAVFNSPSSMRAP